MGNWSVCVHGVGGHHNGKINDIEKLAETFVKACRMSGQQVDSAIVVTGGAIPLAIPQVSPGDAELEHGLSLGRKGYEAYFQKAGGVSLATGAQLPPWDKLSPETQVAWGAAAVTIAAYATQTPRVPPPSVN